MTLLSLKLDNLLLLPVRVCHLDVQ